MECAEVILRHRWNELGPRGPLPKRNRENLYLVLRFSHCFHVVPRENLCFIHSQNNK